ncbi:glutaminyl-peptide cyclotransferase [Sphingomonas lacunae]|uniref:Glutaminyl-peptide cyclotransferase n=1 Tax=Sphingomonas lacunae TaxID=2698828 RepID=A0A6M4AX25_9SPHN|nr:glutaminyl-peptide cyclotransferase [Sphingomonas lacunae]QJQ33326.1 glutaminyl-peptide cyclotransferase [Sphingomonas lacunae]
MAACTLGRDRDTLEQPLQPVAGSPIHRFTAEIINRYPHDPRAFTQGLLVHEGQLHESTGGEGRSDIRKVDLTTGHVLARARFDSREFGEGLAVWQDELVALTWTSGVARRWRLSDLTPTGVFRYQGEGWGLTSDGVNLIQSDGSATLYFRDPETFAVRRSITVTLAGRPLERLNELEFINGLVWANVWMSRDIALINPADGRVVAMLDLTQLVQEVGQRDLDAVANGIAWDADARRLFVTGKLWPTLFEIGLPPLQP